MVTHVGEGPYMPPHPPPHPHPLAAGPPSLRASISPTRRIVLCPLLRTPLSGSGFRKLFPVIIGSFPRDLSECL